MTSVNQLKGLMLEVQCQQILPLRRIEEFLHLINFKTMDLLHQSLVEVILGEKSSNLLEITVVKLRKQSLVRLQQELSKLWSHSRLKSNMLS